MKVLVTGASGFVGKAVVRDLADKGHQVIAVERSSHPPAALQLPSVTRCYADLLSTPDFAKLLDGVGGVVHLAGRAHVRRGGPHDVRDTFWPLNVDVTARLAEASARAGVKAFIFMSSIGVMGDETTDHAYTESSEPRPYSLYAQSKLEAEQIVRETSGLQSTILRPPLIVGPGEKANLHTLLRLIHSGVPLPLGSVSNRRNIAGLGNVAAFVSHCLSHSKAGGEVFLVADEPALSTPDLIRRLARARGKPARLIPMPVSMLRSGGAMLGLESALGGLWKSLEIDMGKAKSLIGWRQPSSIDESIASAAHDGSRSR